MDKRTPERLVWLKNNPSVWAGYPLNNRTVMTVHGMMQVAGLYSFTTHWFDSINTIKKLICRCREELI